jgi:hypothetical protein
VLLGQTITLALNIRYDGYLHGGPAGGLGSLVICGTMVTQGSLVGPDGKPGTGDEVIDPGPDGILGTGDDPKMTVTIPNNVLSALCTIGDNTQTVHNLLTLANMALAGQAPAGVTVADVNFAVNSINVGFDRCRFLISKTNCGNCGSATNMSSPQGDSQVVGQNYLPAVSTPFVNRLNLFSWLTDTNNLLGKLLTVPVDSEITPAYQRLAELSGKKVIRHSILMPANT